MDRRTAMRNTLIRAHLEAQVRRFTDEPHPAMVLPMRNGFCVARPGTARPGEAWQGKARALVANQRGLSNA